MNPLIKFESTPLDVHRSIKIQEAAPLACGHPFMPPPFYGMDSGKQEQEAENVEVTTPLLCTGCTTKVLPQAYLLSYCLLYCCTPYACKCLRSQIVIQKEYCMFSL